MLKNLGKQGFSLIELMVVVAIIGVLASVAVPQYSKFQAKARQAEAKVQLGAIYTVEKAYQLEANGFTGCLGSIGYAPDVTAGTNNSKGFYAIGFAAAPSTLTRVNAAVCTHGAGETWWNATKFAAGTAAANTAQGGWIPNTAPNQANVPNGGQTFIIGAAGSISSTATTNTQGNCDQWTVNENQAIQNVRVGL